MSVSTSARNFSVSESAFECRTVSRSLPAKNSTMPTVVVVAHTHAVPGVAVPLAAMAVTSPQASSPPCGPAASVVDLLVPALNTLTTAAGLKVPASLRYPSPSSPLMSYSPLTSLRGLPPAALTAVISATAPAEPTAWMAGSVGVVSV